MYTIQMVLTLIRATRKQLRIVCQLYLYALFPMFIAHNHNNYAQYVPVYLITHRRCKELLEQNGFSLSQSLILCLRNAFDIAIMQPINPMPSQRRYYRLQQLELRLILQMEYIEYTSELNILKQLFDALKSNIQSA